ncbi:DUF1648 domain-containing protein [Corynebacterium sp.]|uniref:DUF1648 domain-containing protein n=1 Tax=Corynebacterium sp. TaxID=1720 RepID=UPI003B3BADFE
MATLWPVHLLALVPPVVLGAGLAAGYGAVPDPMPVHWGADGSPDSWVDRSLPLLLFITLAAPVVAAVCFLVAAAGMASQGGGVPVCDTERSRNDACNTWAHAESAQKPSAWSAVALSTSLTVAVTGLAGPWNWAGGALVMLGGVGAVATLVVLVLVTGQASRTIDFQ